jgi:hypothetical protein
MNMNNNNLNQYQDVKALFKKKPEMENGRKRKHL